MKKWIVVLLTFVVLFNLIFFFIAKFPLWRISDAASVATGLSAKMACSGKYVNHLDNARILSDLSSYSPVTHLVSIKYNDQQKSVSTHFLGSAYRTASYRYPIGCTLNIGDTSQIDLISSSFTQQVRDFTKAQKFISNSLAWPQGSRIDNVKPNIQSLVTSLVELDNTNNLDTRAFIVVKDGQIVAHSYASGFNENSVFLGWSMAKSLTSIIVGHLMQQEVISLDQIQHKALFNNWQNDERKFINLEDLLTMTSGLEFDETYTPGTDSTEMLFESNSISKIALDASLEHEPASYFSYSSGTTNLIAQLIYKHLGNNPQDNLNFLHKEFLPKLGITSGVFETDAQGVFIGSSYFHANAQDWAKLALLMLNRGQLNGHKIFSEQYYEAALRPNSSENNKNFGFQFWLNGSSHTKLWPSLPDDAFAMRGNRSQVIMMIPSKNLAFIRLGWTKGDYPFEQRFAQLLKEIN